MSTPDTGFTPMSGDFESPGPRPAGPGAFEEEEMNEQRQALDAAVKAFMAIHPFGWHGDADIRAAFIDGWHAAPSNVSSIEPSQATAEQDEKDAKRYRWLRTRLFSTDWAYGEPPVCVITFLWPGDAPIGIDLDAAIDAALKGE